MNAPCKTCDRQTATHRATNPRETDRRYRTWLICGGCIRRAVAHGIDLTYEPLADNEWDRRSGNCPAPGQTPTAERSDMDNRSASRPRTSARRR